MLSDVWGAVDFSGPEDFQLVRRLTTAVSSRLDAEKLVTGAATNDHVRWFYSQWQMPMYNLDFAMIDVPMDDLEAEREAAMWSGIGYTDDEY